MLLLAPSLLALAALAAPGSDHAPLHPAKTDLYLSIPDVGAAYAAYADVPLMRILGEPEIEALLAGFGVDLSATFEAALAQAMPGVDVAEFMGQVRGLSYSLSVGPADAGGELIVDFADASVAATVSSWMRDEAPASTTEGGLTRYEMEDTGLPAWFRTDDARLFLGVGSVTAEGAALRAGDGAAGFVPPAHRFPESPGTVLLDVFTTKPLFDTVEQGARLSGKTLNLPRQLEPLGASGHARFSLESGRFVADVFEPNVDESSPLGIQDVNPAWIEGVPAGVFGVYSTSVDAGRLAGLARGFLERSFPGQVDLAGLEEQLGFALDEPCKALGPGLVAYMFPVRGIGIPASFAWIEVADAEAFRTDLDALLAKLPELLPGAKASTRDYRPRDAATGERVRIPITTINLPPGMLDLGPMITFTPTLALLEDRVLFGVSSMSVKRELKRLFGPKAEANLLTASGLELGEGVRSFAYVDFGVLIEGVFELAKSLGGLMGSMGGGELPFDPASLPDPDVITQHLEPTVYTSRVGEDGVTRRLVSSFGPELLALPLVLVGIAQSSAVQPIAAPAPVQEQGPDPAEVTSARLDELRTALEVYRLTLESYPLSLADLKRATTDFPGGFLEGELPNDGWGRAFRYVRAADGAGYELRSVGPNGTDEAGEGDDVALD